MEVLEPSNFFEIASLFGGIFTGAVAIVGLIIASATLFVGKEALSIWKKEKEFDINIEGLANSFDAVKNLEDLKNDQYNYEYVKDVWGEVLTDIFNKNELDVYNSFIKVFSYSQYYNKLKDRLFVVRKQALKVMNVSTDAELIDFYRKYIVVEANIFNIHHNYHFSKINNFIDKYDYKKISKEEYAVCGYFNSAKQQYPNIPNEKIYEDLYKNFFENRGGDPIEPMRAQVVSFYSRKQS